MPARDLCGFMGIIEGRMSLKKGLLAMRVHLYLVNEEDETQFHQVYMVRKADPRQPINKPSKTEEPLSIQTVDRRTMLLCSDLIESEDPYMEVLDARTSVDYSMDEVVISWPEARHMLALPIMTWPERKRMGALCIFGKEPETTSVRELDFKFLRSMAAQLYVCEPRRWL